MAEPVVVGNLVFELDEDPEGLLTVSIHRVMDLEGWVSFTPCPEHEMEWGNLRNNSYPLNGSSNKPPVGSWIVLEYVGSESSSLNLEGDRSEKGFTDSELMDLARVVNLFYGTPSRLRTAEMPTQRIEH